MIKLKSGIAIVAILFLFGCGAYVSQNLEPREARIGAVTPEYKELKTLPEPLNPIPVAVYNFRDQTGQYKPSETGASWSTAVTQGATTILVNTLEESGWFIPIERENISNLLNERKIIRSSRQQYGNNEALPPLLFAGVILEGGIISYETNIRTGGSGIRYFGADASGQYREDRVSIYIRAVSTKNGKVLKTVNTTKTILSQKVDVGLFRFVSFRRLLEFETGFTFNEPSDMAVTGAIEKGVHSLIIEGIFDGLWTLKNSEDMAHPAVVAYQQEKRNNLEIDYLGRRKKERRGEVGAGISGGVNVYAGDYPNSIVQPTGEINLSYNFSPSVGLYANMAHGDLETENYRGNFTHGNLSLLWKLLPRDNFSPYIAIGPGLMFEHNNTLPFVPKYRYLWKVSGIIGGEYLLNDELGLYGEGTYNLMFDDKLDGVEQGQLNDIFYEGKVGVRYYFNLSKSEKEKKKEAKSKVPDLGEPVAPTPSDSTDIIENN